MTCIVMVLQGRVAVWYVIEYFVLIEFGYVSVRYGTAMQWLGKVSELLCRVMCCWGVVLF